MDMRCVKSLEPAPGTDEPLYGALVLYHNSVAVLDLAACDDYPLRLLIPLAGHCIGVTAVNRDRLSLSRLNHLLPWGQAYLEVMQGPAEFHDEITDALLPQPEPIFHNATALHPAVDMLDSQSAMVQRLVRHVLLPCELRAAGFLRRPQ